MSDHVIECERLTRAFGGRVVVDDLTLSIPRGCVTAFLGRNGSGKTTTLRMILGLFAPPAEDGTEVFEPLTVAR